jgi:hypothetical protein
MICVLSSLKPLLSPTNLGVHEVVPGISVDAVEDTVLVRVSANLERLFPSVVSDAILTEKGLAEIRDFSH